MILMSLQISFDIGDIIAQESIKIEPCVTAAELTQKMAHQGGDLLLKVLSDLPRSLEHAIPQPTEGVTLGRAIEINAIVCVLTYSP